MRLQDKAAIVTGGGSGIGRGICIRFAQEGASLCVADMDEEMGRETVSLVEKNGGKAIFARGDVSVDADAKRIVETTIRELGRLHILVNNAASFIQGGVLDVSVEDFDRSIAVNVRGPFLMARHAAPEIAKNGGGTIINLSSVAGLVASEGEIPYITSKTAVLGLTRSMAVDLGPKNIRVNAICPGAVHTPALESMLKAGNLTRPEAEEAWGEKFIIKGFADPVEFANVAVFLASDESSYVTGTHIAADGGYTAM